MIQTVGSVSFSDYTTAIKAGNKQHIKIVFTSQNKTIYESQISIDGLDYTCHLNPDEDIDYGTAVMTQIETDLINKDGTLSDIDFTQEFAVFLGVEINGNTVWQQIGIFNGEQPNKTHDEIIHLTGYDRMRKMEIPSNEFFKQEPEGKTLAQYFADICLFCGVTAASIPVHAVNVGRTYDKHPTTGEGLTCRDIISMLAEAMGCHVRFNYDGQCQLIWFTDTAYEIPQGWPYSLDIAEYEAPAVDRLQVKSTDNDVGVIVPDTSLGKNAYELVNNPFLFGTSDEDIRPSATALYNKINGFGTYVPAVVEEDGTWLIEAGDIITYTDQLGNSRSLAIFTVHIHWNGRADITYESTGNRQRNELTAQNRQALQLGWRFHDVINSIDELKSIIGSLDFSKVYVQLQDPVETAEELHVGDMWVKAEDPWQTWEDAQPYTWQEAVDNHIWAGNLGSETYSWDGSQWIPVSSQAMLVAHQTAIDQNSQQISLIAEQTADIEGVVARESARIDVTSDRITQEVVRATNAENGKIAKTTQYQTADEIVSEAVTQAASSASNNFIAKTTVYQSATDIVATAEAYTDDNAYKKQSGISINANGVEVSGSKYVKIGSGGSFTVQSGNFSIDSAGNVNSTGNMTATNISATGTINANSFVGNWKVNASGHLVGSGDFPITLNPNTRTSVGQVAIGNMAWVSGTNTISEYEFNNNPTVVWISKGASIGCNTVQYINTPSQRSSRSIKHDIHPIEPCGDRLDRLTPVSFKYNMEPLGATKYGLIYEDTIDVFPEVCTPKSEGTPAIRYVDLVPFLLKEIQDLRARVAAMENSQRGDE